MTMFAAANRNYSFASACTEASSACSASYIVIMGAMIMAPIFVVIISLLGMIRLPLLIMILMISLVLGRTPQ